MSTQPIRRFHLRSPLWLAAVGVVALGCGSDANGSAQVDQLAQSIPNGTPVENKPGNIFSLDGCAATLVAPNLVLTARHCVVEFQNLLVDCNLGDESAFQEYPIGEPVSETLPIYEQEGDESATAVGVEVFASSVLDICAFDIALVRLNKNLDAPVAPLRLFDDEPLQRGEKLLAYGWGALSAKGDTTGTLHSGDGHMLYSGPGYYYESPWPAYPIQAGKFLSDVGACSGDSGGPVFSVESGALVGFISRFGNLDHTRFEVKDITKPFPWCDGPVLAEVVEVQAHRELVLSAFESVGFAPRLEGREPPSELGGACLDDRDCHSGLCVSTAGGRFCSQSCAEASCPDDFVCLSASEGRFCARAGGDEPGASACALGRSSRGDAAWLCVLLALLFAISRRRSAVETQRGRH